MTPRLRFLGTSAPDAAARTPCTSGCPAWAGPGFGLAPRGSRSASPGAASRRVPQRRSTGIFVNPSPGRRIDDDINTGGAPVNWIFRAFFRLFVAINFRELAQVRARVSCADNASQSYFHCGGAPVVARLRTPACFQGCAKLSWPVKAVCMDFLRNRFRWAINCVSKIAIWRTALIYSNASRKLRLSIC